MVAILQDEAAGAALLDDPCRGHLFDCVLLRREELHQEKLSLVSASLKQTSHIFSKWFVPARAF